MKDEEFKLQVVQRLAAIEIGVKHAQVEISATREEVRSLQAYKNKAIGIVGVLSVFGSASVTFIFHALRNAFLSGNKEL